MVDVTGKREEKEVVFKEEEEEEEAHLEATPGPRCCGGVNHQWWDVGAFGW